MRQTTRQEEGWARSGWKKPGTESARIRSSRRQTSYKIGDLRSLLILRKNANHQACTGQDLSARMIPEPAQKNNQARHVLSSSMFFPTASRLQPGPALALLPDLAFLRDSAFALLWNADDGSGDSVPGNTHTVLNGNDALRHPFIAVSPKPYQSTRNPLFPVSNCIDLVSQSSTIDKIP